MPANQKPLNQIGMFWYQFTPRKLLYLMISVNLVKFGPHWLSIFLEATLYIFIIFILILLNSILLRHPFSFFSSLRLSLLLLSHPPIAPSLPLAPPYYSNKKFQHFQTKHFGLHICVSLKRDYPLQARSEQQQWGLDFCTRYFYRIVPKCKLRPKSSTLILAYIPEWFWLIERVFCCETLPTQAHNLELSAD